VKITCSTYKTPCLIFCKWLFLKKGTKITSQTHIWKFKILEISLWNRFHSTIFPLDWCGTLFWSDENSESLWFYWHCLRNEGFLNFWMWVWGAVFVPFFGKVTWTWFEDTNWKSSLRNIFLVSKLKFVQPYTVAAQLERRRSIKILDFLAAHYGLFRRKIVENYRIFGRFFVKIDHSVPKFVSWRSNQEWRSICADTVHNFF